MEPITEQRFVDRLIHALTNYAPAEEPRILPGEMLARLAASGDTVH